MNEIDEIKSKYNKATIVTKPHMEMTQRRQTAKEEEIRTKTPNLRKTT